MVRITQFKIRWYLVAVPIIAYLCLFPELAVLLGIFLAALAFVAPVLGVVYLVVRFMDREQGPGSASASDPAASPAGGEPQCVWPSDRRRVTRERHGADGPGHQSCGNPRPGGARYGSECAPIF